MGMDMKEKVREYYGETLKTQDDLKTDACCSPAAVPPHIRRALAKVHEEVQAKYYGCGLDIPLELEGLSVLDLGSGSGRDCYVLSQLVGPAGRVVGVDMTEEQLAVARRHLDSQARMFGYARSNVEFIKGDIERLREAGLADASFDLVVSNCVVNLAQDKEAVLREVRRVLKAGGEFYFSDVYADRRVPARLREDPVFYGECLGGALYWNDFLQAAKKAGFADPRLVESRPLALSNDEMKAKAGPIRFFSATYRLFAIPELESACEDYGQAAVYKGTLAESPGFFDLDGHHRFLAGKVREVCGNTYLMIEKSRFKRHFDLLGSWESHHGIFQGCGVELPFQETGEGTVGSGCC